MPEMWTQETLAVSALSLTCDATLFSEHWAGKLWRQGVY